MSIFLVILSVLYIAVCIGLITIILLQKKRTSGMGSLSGMGSSQTYWDKNKGRSMEGVLENYSKIGGVVLFVFTMLMCVVK